MKTKHIFKRIEQKYILTPDMAELLCKEVEKHMQPDAYGETEILNIYYDTPDNRLIRNSIDKPTFKEKLRLRSYGVPKTDTAVFLELKRKYKGVVYKRRLKLPYNEAVKSIEECSLPDTQIGKEIGYFISFYKTLKPSMVISYMRKAYFDGEFRATFDSNIRYRCDDLDLKSGGYGDSVTESVIMELKSEMGLPPWMLKLLSEHKVYKRPFSKYGTAYKKVKGEKQNG